MYGRGGAGNINKAKGDSQKKIAEVSASLPHSLTFLIDCVGSRSQFSTHRRRRIIRPYAILQQSAGLRAYGTRRGW